LKRFLKMDLHLIFWMTKDTRWFLGLQCPNEQCEPILDSYIPRSFQWYKKRHKTLNFDPWNCSLKFRDSIRTPSGLHFPKWELLWECEGSLPHTPSPFFTLPGVCDMTPGLLLGPQPCTPLPWSVPKARVATLSLFTFSNFPSSQGNSWNKLKERKGGFCCLCVM
jgi:hypothetical protein